MLPTAEDHFARIFTFLAAHPARAATLLANAVPESETLALAPLTSASPLSRQLLNAWHNSGQPGPLVLLEDRWQDQLAILQASLPAQPA
jgi:hypothetical protein